MFGPIFGDSVNHSVNQTSSIEAPLSSLDNTAAPPRRVSSLRPSAQMSGDALPGPMLRSVSVENYVEADDRIQYQQYQGKPQNHKYFVPVRPSVKISTYDTAARPGTGTATYGNYTRRARPPLPPPPPTVHARELAPVVAATKNSADRTGYFNAVHQYAREAGEHFPRVSYFNAMPQVPASPPLVPTATAATATAAAPYEPFEGPGFHTQLSNV